MSVDSNNVGSPGPSLAGGKGTLHEFSAHRTEVQVRPHEGFTPSAVAVGISLTPTSAKRTLRLAAPPSWHPHGDAPCQLDMDAADTLNAKAAEALCAPCPVRDICLASALAEEGSRGRDQRHLVRGGKTGLQRFSIWTKQQNDKYRKRKTS